MIMPIHIENDILYDEDGLTISDNPDRTKELFRVLQQYYNKNEQSIRDNERHQIAKEIVKKANG